MTEEGTTGAPEPELPPYRLEGARSSRSRCKTCRKPIKKDTLRIGFLIDGPFGQGYLWHHLNCAARRHLDRVEEAYSLESWTAGLAVPTLASLRTLAEKAEREKQERREPPWAEIAPTDRSSCKQCGDKVDKDGVRIVLLRRVEFGSQVRTGPIKVHPRCVAAALAAEDSATAKEGLFEALRSASGDMPSDRLDQAIAEIGSLD